jgi:ferredoxin
MGAAREAAVPAVMAATLLAVERGDVPADLAAQTMTLCTDCGACQDHCHLGTPLPDALRRARVQALDEPPMAPLEPITGHGHRVVVESDERRWAGVLADHLGEPLRVWRTTDDLGVAAIEHPGFEGRLRRIRDRVGSAELIVSSGGTAQVLDAAGVTYRWVRELVPTLPRGAGSCRVEGARPFACCGAAGPLRRYHPDDAARLGALWLDRLGEWRVADSRCRTHLGACGGRVTDPVDALLAGDFVR